MHTMTRARRLAGASLLLVVLLAGACRASDDDGDSSKPPKRWRFTLKPSASAYWPLSDKVRDRFGDSWTSLGISVGLRDEDRVRNRVAFDADAIIRRYNGNHVYIVPLGVSYKHRFITGDGLSPYGGLGGYVCPIDVESAVDGVDTGIRFASGLRAFVGADVGTRIKLEANYYAFPPVEGFDFSGIRVNASLSF